jgi:hypothetical protein
LKTVIANRVDKDGKIILKHFLARRIGEIKPGPTTIEWQWFKIDNLPANVTPNVQEIILDL